jgi:hypothetical protein
MTIAANGVSRAHTVQYCIASDRDMLPTNVYYMCVIILRVNYNILYQQIAMGYKWAYD